MRKQRLLTLCLILSGIGIAVAVALYALQQNINLFFTPSDVVAGRAPHDSDFRLGGMVKRHSVHRDNHSLAVSFTLSDLNQEVVVNYRGILPDLFREGQGIVTEGRLTKAGTFTAKQVLAKHDANYMPPGVKSALKQSQG